MNYSISPISNAVGRRIYEKHHYATRHPIIQQSFDLFRGDDLVGTASFGPPVSPQTRRWVDFELNRLALTHNRRNEASQLISGALRLIGYVTVISYADPAHGHNGAIYRAANFTYHGFSERWRVPVRKGQLDASVIASGQSDGVTMVCRVLQSLYQKLTCA